MSEDSTEMTPEEAEAQIRAAIAEANLRDDNLDAFVARVPTMRASDLFCYLIDHEALAIAIGAKKSSFTHARLPSERLRLIRFAVVFAIKDEIDRRFPAPSPTPKDLL